MNSHLSNKINDDYKICLDYHAKLVLNLHEMA
jgi:plasmid maintenance system killer protein